MAGTVGGKAGAEAAFAHPATRIGCSSAMMGIMKYPVALVRTEEGYSVSCPGLPGCWSQGATEEEALENIRAALREYLEVAKDLAGKLNLREVDIPA
jgi:predicted RNase H-like HicB family nuclease